MHFINANSFRIVIENSKSTSFLQIHQTELRMRSQFDIDQLDNVKAASISKIQVQTPLLVRESGPLLE